LAGIKPGIRENANTAMNKTGSSLLHFSFTWGKDNSLRDGDKFSIRWSSRQPQVYFNPKSEAELGTARFGGVASGILPDVEPGFPARRKKSHSKQAV
jgi:hypothetical protein